ncbi:MAG: DUF1598 domain-containing protein [Planctomycetes bacterium]|nr:DUF1598 domain-containing protein [Planctomycetota bacterium]
MPHYRVLLMVVVCATAVDPVIAQQLATTVQLPTFGVAIDADGALAVTAVEDPGGRLHAARVTAAKASLPPDLAAWSNLRKISLVRLEQAVRRELDAGRAPDDAMRCLAGLQRLRYVFFYPETREIVIAGPAEGWARDGVGRPVGLTTGRPVLELQDLVVALRAYPPGSRHKPFIGCTIDPPQEGLARLRKFQQTIPKAIPAVRRAQTAAYVARGMEEALGMADVRVFTISPETHFAQVLIEADYRMKRIGIGREPPPVRMITFLSAVSGPSDSVLCRWWFTPDYDCVRTTPDRLAMELVGDGVQLLAEDKLVGPDGQLGAGAPPSKASEAFTTSFTKNYSDIAARSPVYAQMRNCIDVLVAAAFVRQQSMYEKAGWRMETLLDKAALPVQTHRTPKQAPCVAVSAWKGNRLLTPAGGGVSIRPDLALEEERLLPDSDGALAAHRKKVQTPADGRWWWD